MNSAPYMPPAGYTLTKVEPVKSKYSWVLVMIAVGAIIASVLFCFLWVSSDKKSNQPEAGSTLPVTSPPPAAGGDDFIDLGLNDNSTSGLGDMTGTLDLGLDIAPMGAGYPINSPPPPMENRQGPPPTIKVGRTNTDEGYNFDEPAQMDTNDVGPRAANRRTKGAPFSY